MSDSGYDEALVDHQDKLVAARLRIAELEETRQTLNDALTATMESLMEAEEDRGQQADHIAELEARLARWREIARAAVLAQRWLDQKAQAVDYSVDLDRARAWERVESAIDALSEEERAEILERGA